MTNKFIEQRVEALENELFELKLIVAQIRKPSTVVEEALANDIIEFEGKQYKKVDREAREGDVVVLNDVGGSHYFETNKPYEVQRDTHINGVGKLSGHKEAHPVYTEFCNRTPETVDVYELIVEDKQEILPPAPKTQNELRAEIIEKAKWFVDENSGDDYHFEIDEEKRTILAWKIYRVGRGYNANCKLATCSSNDVFNEHIGKAIALGRALGLDVSEFEQAVQPTHATGQVCEIQNWYGHNGNLTTLKYSNESGFYHTYYGGWLSRADLKIINDTNAIYEMSVPVGPAPVKEGF